mgnify:FL=1
MTLRAASASSAPDAARATNWLVREGSLREVPTYYPLEKSSRFVQGSTTEEIAAQISECCRIMSVQGNFDHGTVSFFFTPLLLS